MSRIKQNIKTLLIVEDDLGLQSQLRWSFEHYEVVLAGDRETAITLLRRHEPAVVLLDLGLPPDPENASEGLAALQQILGLAPHTKIIVVTGNDERSNAVKAIALGAYDFYQKPIEPDILNLIVERAFHVHELEEENRRLTHQPVVSPLEGIIAASDKMLKVCRTVERVAPTNATVLLLGESGTGKEVLARALHSLSPRVKNNFVAINCAAIPDALLESELFGYEKGAFTGAVKQTRGKIEYADGGTLFLDEIGDLPPPLQAKLLRFLQERVVDRIGGREPIPVDVRVICATHQDLQALIAKNVFREDLYYRVSELAITIPPLRERSGDAVLLAKVYLTRFNKEYGRNLRGFDTDAMQALAAYHWPGNVRELENRVKRAVIMAEQNEVQADDLELAVAQDQSLLPLNLREAREQAERQAIVRTMALCNSNISQAADLLGVTRPTLYDLMNKLGLVY